MHDVATLANVIRLGVLEALRLHDDTVDNHVALSFTISSNFRNPRSCAPSSGLRSGRVKVQPKPPASPGCPARP